jgi:malate synthase
MLSVLSFLAQFNTGIKEIMASRSKRRENRLSNKKRIQFLDPDTYILGNEIKVQDAREGKFEAAIIPMDLQRQRIQGTGPAAKPNASVESSIRNVATRFLIVVLLKDFASNVG